MVPFWVPSIIRHLAFRGARKDHNFDNHPYKLFKDYSSVFCVAGQRGFQLRVL